MWLCLKLCTDGVLNVLYLKLCADGVLNVAVFKIVYRRGTECGCF